MQKKLLKNKNKRRKTDKKRMRKKEVRDSKKGRQVD